VIHTALWVIAGALAAAMLLAGALKLSQSNDELLRRGIHLPERFSNTAVKALGLAEVLGAAGLILPGIAHRGTVLVPVAALCFIVVLSGGVILHISRHDGFREMLPGMVPLALSVIVAWGRLSPYAL
jgi:uncharacterized membrane protein